jgi:hypothetical protein
MVKRLLLVVLALLAFACGPAGESVDSADEALETRLAPGEYVSKATSYANAGYIGDWEHEWGYVLGYMRPGARIYAKVVRGDSVYGLIVNSNYGAWDNGHHCGWVSLKHLKGHGFHSSVADSCPPFDDSFSLARGSGGPIGFRPGSWTECDGCVQPAIVLPACSDFNVYANYDPATHTFHDPDGSEVAGRGTIDVHGHAYAGATQGYSGFGTRFVTTDQVAVEIKDTRRTCNVRGGCTAFGFMHADCIGGTLVGTPAGKGATPPPVQTQYCGKVTPGEGLASGRTVNSCNLRYSLTMQTDGNLVLRDSQKTDALWASNTSNTDGYVALFQTDGNLVVYGTNQDVLWASHTNGKGAVLLMLQDDGNVVLYDAQNNAIWQTGTAGQ